MITKTQIYYLCDGCHKQFDDDDYAYGIIKHQHAYFLCPECFGKLIDNIWLVTKDLEAKLGKGENLGPLNISISIADINDISADVLIGRIILIDKVMNRPIDLAIEINGEFLEVTGIEDKGYLSEAIKQKFFVSAKLSYVKDVTLAAIKDKEEEAQSAWATTTSHYLN